MNIWRYGDNIDTDLLFPGKYVYTCNIPEEVKPHLLEDLDSSFSKNVKEGDIIIAGKNFGCGSSREQPVAGLKSVGIKAIIAKSFARIYFRNLINVGIPGITLNWDEKSFSKGDNLEISLEKGVIFNITKNIKVKFAKLPEFLTIILNEGGIINQLKKILSK